MNERVLANQEATQQNILKQLAPLKTLINDTVSNEIAKPVQHIQHSMNAYEEEQGQMCATVTEIKTKV